MRFEKILLIFALVFLSIVTVPALSKAGSRLDLAPSIGSETLDNSFNPAIGFAGRIITAAKQPDGKIIVGGLFANAGGVTCSNVARFLENGALDPAFALPVVNNAVTEIALQPDGKIIIAGTFTNINGTARSRIARLNANGSLDASFNVPGEFNSNILTIAVQSTGSILVGGDFSFFNAAARVNLARLEPNGALDPSFTSQVGGFGTSVTHIAVAPDDNIFVAGNYTQIGGVARTNLAKLDSDGTVIQEFNASISSGTVNETQVLADGKLMIGGRVSIGPTLIHIARLNYNGTLDNTFAADARINSWVSGFTLHPDGRIFVYGSSFMNSSTGEIKNLFMLNPTGAVDESFSISSMRNQTSFAKVFVQADGKIILVGEFQRINGVARFSLARVDATGAVDQTYTAYTVTKGFQTGSTISTMAFQPDGKILVGGNFVQVAGKPRRSLARLTADGQLDESFNQPDILFTENTSTAYLNAIALQPDGKILIAGDFSSVNGQPRNAMVRLNPDGTLDPSFNIGFGPSLPIWSITLQADGKILIGGQFGFISGTQRKLVARLNSDGTIDTSFDANASLDVGAGKKIIIQPDNKILVTGVWQNSNNQWRGMIRLNMDGTRDNSFNVLTNDQGPDMELLPDGKIFIGGFFSSVNGTARAGVARLNADGSLDNTFAGGGVNNGINAVARAANGKYIVAGQFSLAQGQPRAGLAAFNSDGSLDTTLFSGTNHNGILYRVFVQPGGKLIVAGDFSLMNNAPRLGVARFLFGKPSPFDFDGDGKTDIGVFRPSDGSWWYTRSSAGDFRVYSFGASTDVITPGDFTGDGKTDVAVFRPSSGEWFVQRSEDNSFFSFPFGASGDLPAPSDYDGDGRQDAAVFRPSSGTWFILNSGGGGTSIVQFGAADDKPVPADYDGDGKTDIAIFRPSDGSWWYLQSSNNQFKVYRFGLGTDKPVPGDYTGDGRADIAIFRPSSGEWYFQRSEDNSYFSVPFGANGDLPAPGDYDGDGRLDTAVFRPSTADWFVQRSTAGILITSFGAKGDRPVPNAFVP